MLKSMSDPDRPRVIDLPVEEDLGQAFLDYSMSVIVHRAIPDVRDGLKPVQRRILYAMGMLGLASGKNFKKCATIVGEVLGKYHPHGDQAVYDTLVRMAQDFSLRVPLVDGQGNFGSIDGDPAAAYRYTEARLTPGADSLLDGHGEGTVDFRETFDGSGSEPEVLPAAWPQLIVNGTLGIAVGISTQIPPHHPGEVLEALALLVEDPDRSDEEIVEPIRGPDFPTGGVVFREKDPRAYLTAGRGNIRVRADVSVEREPGGRVAVVVESIPYAASRETIFRQLISAIQDRTLEGVADLRDESDREGTRIVLPLRRTADPVDVIGQMFDRTRLESTFRIDCYVIDSGRPERMSIAGLLRAFLVHRVDVIERRSRKRILEIRTEVHRLDGLLIALARIEDVVQWIKSSEDREEAKDRLQLELGVEEAQASAILRLQLSGLTGLDHLEVQKRKEALTKEARSLETLISDERALRGTVLSEARSGLGDVAQESRRTRVLLGGSDRAEEIREEAVLQGVFVWDRDGVSYSEQPGERSFVFQETKVRVGTPVYAFLEDGTVRRLEESGHDGPAVVALIAEPDLEGEVVFVSTHGQAKRTHGEEITSFRGDETSVMRLSDGDRLGFVRLVPEGAQDIIAVSSNGKILRTELQGISHQGRAAGGVILMRLEAEDFIRSILIDPGQHLCLLSSRGLGKRIELDEVNAKGRGTRGVLAFRDMDRVGEVVFAGVPGRYSAILDRKPATLDCTRWPIASRAALGDRVLQGHLESVGARSS